MPRSFDIRAQLKDRRVVVRVALGGLLAANLVAAVFVFHPLGGSAEDLARQMRAKQRDLAQQLQRVERTRSLVAKVQQAKVEGDKFLDECTLNRRIAYSTLVGEMDKMAVQSGMRPKESSSQPEPVPGSDTIEELTISANYEGSYASLTKFVNMLDKSPRFLIIESMQAQPQSNGGLNVNIRLDTFIREAPGGKP
jgi:type IV pilus assembly protein PilO